MVKPPTPSLLTVAGLASRAPEVRWAPAKGDTQGRGLAPSPTTPLTSSPPSSCHTGASVQGQFVGPSTVPRSDYPPLTSTVSFWVSFPATAPQSPKLSFMLFPLSAVQILMRPSLQPPTHPLVFFSPDMAHFSQQKAPGRREGKGT